MNILTDSAEFLNKGLFYLAAKNMPRNFTGSDVYAMGADIFNAKVHIFNACTIALINCIVLGVFGVITPTSAICSGVFSLFGRKVTNESFNVMLPSFIRSFAPNILTPKSWLSYGETVIFYDTTPRNFLDD